MGRTRPVRSLLASDALLDYVRDSYGLPAARDCVLLRSLVNDVYRVATPEGEWILKVYNHQGRSVDEVTWEADLIAHLLRSGLPTAPVVPLAGGSMVGVVRAPEGDRAAVLFETAAGTRPRPPFGPGLKRRYGRLTARLHRATEGFRSAHSRTPTTLDRLFGRALPPALQALDHRPGAKDREFIVELAGLARRRLERLTAAGLDWGVCQGDVSLDNVHELADDGLLVYDFDAAAEGWRAADLWGPRLGTHWRDFLTGYREVRELGDRELEAVDWMVVPQVLDNLRFHLVDLARWRGEQEADGRLDESLATLRRWAEGVLAGYG